jgi:cobalt-zinc-cadmium efflux system outer membrane protein
LLRRSIDNAPALLEQAASVPSIKADARQAHGRPTVGVEFENIGAVRQVTAPARRKPPSRSPSHWNWPSADHASRQAKPVCALRGARRQVRFDYAAQLALAYATAEAMQLRLQLAQEDVARANKTSRPPMHWWKPERRPA